MRKAIVEKIWLEKSYPSEVPFEIDADKYPSIVAMFTKYSTQYSDKTAFINMGASISYEELLVQATAFAAYLQQDLGLEKGDKFAK